MSAAAVAAAAALVFSARPIDRPPAEKSLRVEAASRLVRPDQVIPATSMAEHSPRATPETIGESVARADPGLRDLILERALPKLVDDDAQAAARFAESQHDPFLREAAERIVAARWADVAPEGASRWAVSLANDIERDQVIEHVALELATSDPHGALSLLECRSRGDRPDAVTAGVIASWASVDFDAALAWAEGQPQSPALNEILDRLVFLKAETDPREAIRVTDRVVGDDSARSDVLASIATVWAAKDPEAAREWVASLDANARRRVEKNTFLD